MNELQNKFRYFLFFSFVFLAQPGIAGVTQQDQNITCDFAISGAPFVTIQIQKLSDGSFNDQAQITHYGKSTYETLTVEPILSGELYRFTLSKESEDNSITMIIYEKLNALLINDHVPYGKEMQGSCKF